MRTLAKNFRVKGVFRALESLMQRRMFLVSKTSTFMALTHDDERLKEGSGDPFGDAYEFPLPGKYLDH